MKNDFYPISKVSKLTGISEKRLRYYDQQGACSPAYRDPDTGYRYYEAGQIPLLISISYLRSLNFPLSLITSFQKTNSLKELMLLKSDIDQQVLQANQEAKQSAYRYEQMVEFRHNVSVGLSYLRSDKSNDVSLIRTELFSVLEYTRTLPFSDLTPGTRLEMMNHLSEQLKKFCFISVGGYALLFKNHPFLTPSQSPTLPMKITYHAQIKNPPSVPLEFIKSTGGVLAATAVHIGPYETLQETYDTITAWARKNGYALSTNSMEEYLITPQMVSNPELYATGVFIPLAGANF